MTDAEDGGGVPEYASMLAAYHEGFAAELKAMVASLPIAEGDRVLDLACGDGAYTRWLAERVGLTGEVVGVDLSGDYLELARAAIREDPGAVRIRFVAGSLDQMPFDDGSFDLVWCAQSLFSLPDPVETLRVARRLVKPGGVVAVLENDTLHQVLLPWPIEVELAVRAAELIGLADESARPRKFYVGRDLLEVFGAAGLVDCRLQTWASDRQQPLPAAERAFLRAYLGDLRDRVTPHLQVEMRERFDRLADDRSDASIADRPGFAMTVIDHLVWGRRPDATS